VAGPGKNAPGRCVPGRLSAYLDGDLPAGEMAAVRAHLDHCPSCAQEAAEISALVGAARTLDRPEPPPTLWPAIAGKLEALDAAERRGLGLLGWRPFAAGAFAGAVAVMVVVLALRAPRPLVAALSGPAAAVTGQAAAPDPSDPLLEEAEAEFSRAAAAYERSIEKLRALLAAEETRWSHNERARYAERLSRLDDAIARSREVARRTRGDDAGNEQLFAAYQQKIAFLTAAVHRGGERGEGIP
jgi:Putative zinc-finger